jgi:hypothetical protein
MKLPRPSDQIAGCYWLPRFAGKARVYLSGNLPFPYNVAFGKHWGIDGLFMKHFSLSIDPFLEAIQTLNSDEALAHWFLAQPTVNRDSIESWNKFSSMIGTKDGTGYLARHLLKYLFYPKAIKRPVNSFFEMIEQDENPETS